MPCRILGGNVQKWMSRVEMASFHFFQYFTFIFENYELKCHWYIYWNSLTSDHNNSIITIDFRAPPFFRRKSIFDVGFWYFLSSKTRLFCFEWPFKLNTLKTDRKCRLIHRKLIPYYSAYNPMWLFPRKFDICDFHKIYTFN